MSADDDFARSLRGRLDAAAPRIDVDLSGVVPRARRRRRTVRAATTLGVSVLVAGTGWLVADAAPWAASDVVPPAVGPVTPPVVPGPTTSPVVPGPTTTEAPTPTVPEPGPAPDVLPSSTHWYTLVETTGPDGTHRSETWLSRDLPGLRVTDGDLSTATGVGPQAVIGRFRIDGAWIDTLTDPALLPTDPAGLAAVLRDSVEEDRGPGSDDDEVYGMARDLLDQGGLLPEELRRAAWAVVAGLPQAASTHGVDSLDRPAEILAYTQDGATSYLLQDPGTGLLLEERTGGASSVRVEQRLVDRLPVEPTLESSGCTSWESC